MKIVVGIGGFEHARALFADLQHAPAAVHICILCSSFASSFVRRTEPDPPAKTHRMTENTTQTRILARIRHNLIKCVGDLPPAERSSPN